MAALTEEQSIIRDQAKTWTLEQAPVQAFRKMRDAGTANGFDAKAWDEMVALGWPGIFVWIGMRAQQVKLNLGRHHRNPAFRLVH